MNDSPWCQDYAAPSASCPAPFAIGDVVSLRGQPQLMTVEDYCEDCGAINVVWFGGNDNDGWTLERDSFDEDMLINLDDDD